MHADLLGPNTAALIVEAIFIVPEILLREVHCIGWSNPYHVPASY